MSDLFVQVSALASGSTTAVATLTGVTAGSTLVAFFGNGSTSAPTTFSVADGQGTYTPQGARVTDPPDAVVLRAFTLENANAGTHTITGTSDSGNGVDLIVVEIGTTAGVGAVSGANQASQVAPGTGANALSSGTVTIPAAATLVCFSIDSASTATGDEPAAGTGFTSRANAQSANCGVYRISTIAASADRAANATAVTGGHTFETLGVAVLNAGAAAPILEDALHRPALMAILAQ